MNTAPALVHFFHTRKELNDYLRSRRMYWEPGRKVVSTYEGRGVGIVTNWGVDHSEWMFAELQATVVPEVAPVDRILGVE